MKQLTLVALHSTVDLITNSSTEIFVCKGSKTISVVKEMLDELLEMWNHHKSSNHDFDTIFAEIHTLSEDEYDFLKSYGNYALKDRTYEECKDFVVISGVSDNSIPWGLMDYIETVFGAERTHGG